MSNITSILKSLRIKKQVSVGTHNNTTIYYFVGTESSLSNIEDKLNNCPQIKNLTREFFTSGFGRIFFEIC